MVPTGGGGGNNTTASSKPFVVNPPLVITSNSPLPAAPPGAAYPQPLFRTGGTAPFAWTVTEGSLPAGLAPGFAVFTATSAGQIVGEGTSRIDAVAPTLFSANSTGSGAPAGIASRAASDGVQTRKNLFAGSATAAACRSAPIVLRDGEEVYLLLFGTGLRGRLSLAGVEVSLGGEKVPVAFAGEQGEAPGFDQINAGPLPRELAGRGPVELVVTVDGQRANALQVHIQ